MKKLVERQNLPACSNIYIRYQSIEILLCSLRALLSSLRSQMRLHRMVLAVAAEPEDSEVEQT